MPGAPKGAGRATRAAGAQWSPIPGGGNLVKPVQHNDLSLSMIQRDEIAHRASVGAV